jgi:hypothetical protein
MRDEELTPEKIAARKRELRAEEHKQTINGEAGFRLADDLYVPPGDPQPFVPKYKTSPSSFANINRLATPLKASCQQRVLFPDSKTVDGENRVLVARSSRSSSCLTARRQGQRDASPMWPWKPDRLTDEAGGRPFPFRRRRFYRWFGDMVTIIDARLPVAEIVAQSCSCRSWVASGGSLGYIQAGFRRGTHNAGILKYAQQLRTTGLPGGLPCWSLRIRRKTPRGRVDPLWRGSGINEADGNLTRWAEDGSIKLHFNRVRGPEFEPLHFRIEKLSSPDICDDEGRQILLPVLRPVSEQTVEQRRATKGTVDLEVLKYLAEEPGLSGRERSGTLGI